MSALTKIRSEEDASQGAALATSPLGTQGRGSNWVHESLAVFETARCGLGVVALDEIPAGTLVVMYGGSVLTGSEFENLSEEMQSFPFQVADDLFIGPRDENDIGIGERINHCCSPNVGFAGEISLVTLRRIMAGEEITLDYATCVACDHGAFSMTCECGASHCRKVITGNDWQSREIQSRLLPFYQPFLQARVRELQRNDRGGQFVRLSAVRNHDLPITYPVRDKLRASITKAPRLLGSFVTNSLREEWMAIPICIVAGLPSTLATTAIVSLLAPGVAKWEFAQSEAGYISTVSLIASVVGYVTYCISYYLGMLWKERQDWISTTGIRADALRHKLRVCKYDFIAHLPYDFWFMPVMGAVTGGFFVAGLSQFWAIVLAHTFADVAYAMKEPFFWHGAKEFAAWRECRNSGATTAPDKIA